MTKEDCISEAAEIFAHWLSTLQDQDSLAA